MRVEYVWLTGAMLAQDEFLGIRKGMPLPFLVRHGICGSRGRSLGVTITDEAECIQQGGRDFYLASVEAKNVNVNWGNVFFLPRILSDGIIVGGELLDRLRRHCNLESGYVIPLNPRWVSAHAWNYSLPENPDDDTLYTQLYEALDFDALPGDDEIVGQLCERYPPRRPLPQLHLILAPWLAPRAEVRKHWQRDCVVLSVGKDVTVRIPGDNIPLSREYLQSQPILRYEGFLIPPSAASLFETDEYKRSWPILTCRKQVILEF